MKFQFKRTYKTMAGVLAISLALAVVPIVTAGASTSVLYTCGSIHNLQVCGTPEYVTSTLANDVVSEAQTIYPETVVQQHAALPNLISDINTVAADVSGLPASEQSGYHSSFATMKYYSDLIHYNIQISGLYITWLQNLWYAFVQGACRTFADLCVPAF